MDFSKRYVICNEKIDYRIIDDRAIILNINSAYFYTLEEAGTVIWKELIKQKTLNEIAELVMDEYEVSKEEANRDIVELISEMEKERLIKPL